ncbi:MAG: MMPL family transporter [Desulfobacter sp.]|nr:MAG: MMPL family transporter [Desulfobacter sp.]
MELAIVHINGFFQALPGRFRQRRKLVWLLFIGLTLFLALGVKNVVIDESLAAYFHKEDPVKQAYDRFRAVFGGDEYLFIIYKARDGDIFSAPSLSALKRLHNRLTNYRLALDPDAASPLDHISEVKSLINVKYMEGGENTLFSRSFIGDRMPRDRDMREAYRRKALDHPDFPRVYLSEDCQYGGVVVRTDFNARKKGALSAPAPGPAGAAPGREGLELDNSGLDSFVLDEMEQDDPAMETGTGAAAEDAELIQTDITAYPAFMAEINKILAAPELEGALEFYPVGHPTLMDFFATAVMEDMGRLMSLVLLLITVTLWILFRSFSAVVWPLTIIGMTIIWILGIIGWAHIPMSAMLQVIIFLSLSVGVADAVHILSGYLFFRNQGKPHSAALEAVMKKSGLACLLTSVTTAAGLLALTLVPLKPIASFGLFAATAVLIAFILTVCLLPLMLDLWAPVPKHRTSEKSHPVQHLLKRVDTLGTGRPGLVIALFSIAGILLFAGLTQLKIDSNFVEIIKEGFPLRDAYTIVDREMGGTGRLEVMLDFKRPDALKAPRVLAAMERIQDYMETHEGSPVITTYSLVNVVKESYKVLNGDNPLFYAVPSDPAVLSQVLFLFENANPADRTRLVTGDYSRARIGLNSSNIGSIKAMDLLKTVQGFIDREFSGLKADYPDMEVTLTGHMALLAIMLDYIAWAQVKSFGLALAVISLILLLVLGSWKAGLVALAPNLFPVLAAFGLMGFFSIPLDADTLLIAPIIIGLAVDDTIHFMTHFRAAMAKTGNLCNAARESIRETGQAISFTSIILSTGFLVFILSFHNGLSRFGIFAALAILAALLADIFLLPALCRAVNLNFNGRRLS